jgi:hypothetical protein
MNMTAEELRRWAARCATDARRVRADEDRDRLMRMREALLALAANEDWINPEARQQANGHSRADGGDRQH